MPAPAADRAIDLAASAASPVTSGRGGPNINPVTGLSTDYLNHFTEAIMLLEILPAMPDCLDDFLAWEPKDYREHFAASRFSNRDAVIAAYRSCRSGAQPVTRYAGRPHEYAAAGHARGDRGQSRHAPSPTPSRTGPPPC